MTFSIIGRCLRTQEIGVGILSADPFVGVHSVHIAENAICVTQAEAGEPQANELLRSCTTEDPKMVFDLQQTRRWQIGLLPLAGSVFALTGGKTFSWSGDYQSEHCVALGNFLSGEHVISSVVERFEATPHLPLQLRIFGAIRRGVEMGGDRRGHQSGRIVTLDSTGTVSCDVRVDVHDNPLGEMERLLKIHSDRNAFFSTLPNLVPLLLRESMNMTPSTTLFKDALEQLRTQVDLESKLDISHVLEQIKIAQPIGEVTVAELLTYLSE